MKRHDQREMVIETSRLSLRPVAHIDLEAWAELLGDPDATRLLHFPEPHSREQSADLLAKTIGRANGGVAMYKAVLRESREIAGFVGYSPRHMEWGDELELGWLLFPAHQGHGYATEAARAVRALVPGRVVSLIRVENAASERVALKIGMKHEQEIEYAGFATHLYASSSP